LVEHQDDWRGVMRAIDVDTARSLLAPLSDAVAAAAAAVLAIDRSSARLDDKDDGSPLTQADLAADRVIADGLARIAPDVPVISEERVDHAAVAGGAPFFIVDPIDGTKEFIAGYDDYTINVALVSAGRPLLGVVSAPALGLLWRGVVGSGAERLAISKHGTIVASSAERIYTRRCPEQHWIAAVSRSHTDSRTEAFIKSRPGAIRKPIGSALKFCRVAEGSADIYPRLAPMSEWDIAAGNAVLEAAGGKVTDSFGRPLHFGGDPASLIVPELIAWGDPAVAIKP
jgi:3'(2'), 5'-bisphosphate nucleotidase